MPIPKPELGESQDSFIRRAKTSPDTLREYPDPEERELAIFEAWNGRVQRSENGYRYQFLDDGRVVVYDVPTYWTHEDERRDPPFDKVDAKLINRIFDGTQARVNAGAFPQLYIGPHIDELSAPDAERETQLVGHVRNLRVANVQSESGSETGIVGDYVFDRMAFEQFIRTGRAPRRSAEIIKEEASKSGRPFLLNVTLLGVSMPALAAKDMVAFTGNVPEGAIVRSTPPELKEAYQMPKSAFSDDQREEMTAMLNTAFESFAEKYGLAVQNQGGDDKDDKESGKCKNQPPDDADDKDKNSGDGGGVKPDQGQPGHPAPGKTANAYDAKDMAAMREAYDARLKAAEDQAKAARDEVAAERAERNAEKVRNALVGLAREGVKLNFDDELGRLKGLDPEAAEKEIARIRENYARSPVIRGVNLEGVERFSDDVDTMTPSEKAEHAVTKKAEELMKANPKLRYHAAKTEARKLLTTG